MAKSKKPAPRQISPEELLAFFNATKDDDGPIGPTIAKAENEEEIVNDISEIGCKLVRMWGKRVEILGWEKKGESLVSVRVNGIVSAYKYPFHRYVMFPFINFEVLEDCGYLERFGNGTEYAIGGKRYGVKDDVVWAGGKRYLSSFEMVKFGSFEKFLAKHPVFKARRTII